MATIDVVHRFLRYHDIIEEPIPELEFQPEERGLWWKKLRSHIGKNIPAYIGGAAVGIGGLAFMLPNSVEIIAKASIIGGAIITLGSKFPIIDRFLLANPKYWAPRQFRKIAASWAETYESISIKNRRQLESYVYSARIAHALKDEFPDKSDQLKLGIMIGKVADILHKIGVNKGSRKVKGFRELDLIRMLREEKLPFEEETNIITTFNEKKVSHRNAWKYIKVYRKYGMIVGHFPEEHREAIKILDKYLHGFSFKLAVQGDSHLLSVGSQMSRGTLRIRGSIGKDTGAYLGMHSKGKDCPVIHADSDVGPSFMTRARRGIAIIKGDAAHELMHKATGGVVVVRGVVDHDLARGMDDTTWPAIVVSYGGVRLQSRDGTVENGLIVSYNNDVDFKDLKPQVWRFRDGIREETLLTHGSRDEFEDQVNTVITDYLTDWLKRRT